MMIHYRCLYLPQNKRPDGGRPEEYWATYHYTMAVKNGLLGDKSRFTAKRDGKIITINKSNATICRDDFADWVAEKINNDIGEPVTLIPVPSKDSIVGAHPPFRSLSLVRHIESRIGVRAIDALRWTEPLERSSKGGSRAADFLYSKLRVIRKRSSERVVLIDDLTTSGSHMKAARKRLDEAGFDVACGIVCGRSIDISHLSTPAFSTGAIEIGESVDPFDDFFNVLDD